jgi:hypothetical protein
MYLPRSEPFFQYMKNIRFQFHERRHGRCGRNGKCEVKIKAQISRDSIRAAMGNDDLFNIFILLNPFISGNIPHRWLNPFDDGVTPV